MHWKKFDVRLALISIARKIHFHPGGVIEPWTLASGVIRDGAERRGCGGGRGGDFNYRRVNSQPDAPTGQITPVILPSFIAGREKSRGLNAA